MEQSNFWQREIQIWKSLKLRGVNKPINQADHLVHWPDSAYGARILAIAGPTNPKHILHTLSRLNRWRLENKFNHSEMDCKPNNTTDSEQLPAGPRLDNLQPQEGGSGTPNQSKKQLRKHISSNTENKISKCVNKRALSFLLWNAPSRLKLQASLKLIVVNQSECPKYCLP